MKKLIYNISDKRHFVQWLTEEKVTDASAIGDLARAIIIDGFKGKIHSDLEQRMQEMNASDEAFNSLSMALNEYKKEEKVFCVNIKQGNNPYQSGSVEVYLGNTHLF